MSRSSTPPASRAGQEKVLNINWRLLGRRLRSRAGQYASSARHRAGQTEYIPPVWMSRLHLTWFRLGLIGLTVFVFTQKQIDFTFTIGSEGVGLTDERAAASAVAVSDHTSALSMLPGGSPAAAPAPAWSVDRLDAVTVRAYVDRFARVARTEEEKFAIPAAAKLAMAILESEAGESRYAREDNNHFSVATPRHRFDNAWSSWRAHSQSIADRFPELADEAVNYQQWIAALAKTEYSRDARYPARLLQIIERFGLDRI
ncbi:glucosaminidase domain-containing protein [Lewinella sp. IMCC34183]|uniref:glucosaminidase domain-containing protein n=1 Tax=Lewinella sp. IMCC34183 TaxID=2248762 RepID=UPI0013005968|nr:glucosaminidase domain-containing protein [Lewinella sp. IMCC34183]